MRAEAVEREDDHEAEHERMKTDPELWSATTEPPYGHVEQPVIAHRDRWLRVGNCRACKSTLYAPTELHLAERR